MNGLEGAEARPTSTALVSYVPPFDRAVIYGRHSASSGDKWHISAEDRLRLQAEFARMFPVAAKAAGRDRKRESRESREGAKAPVEKDLDG